MATAGGMLHFRPKQFIGDLTSYVFCHAPCFLTMGLDQGVLQKEGPTFAVNKVVMKRGVLNKMESDHHSIASVVVGPNQRTFKWMNTTSTYLIEPHGITLVIRDETEKFIPGLLCYNLRANVDACLLSHALQLIVANHPNNEYHFAPVPVKDTQTRKMELAGVLVQHKKTRGEVWCV